MADFSEDLTRAQAYLAGDPATEKWLYGELRRIAHFLIGELEKAGAVFVDREEAVSQTVFHAMVRHDRHVIRSYKGDCKLTTYLYRVVRNHLVDVLRKERRHQFVPLTEAEHESRASGPGESTASLAELVLEHIEQEKPADRLIKMSRWVDDNSYEEIQERLKRELNQQVSTQHVAYVLHRNRKALQEKLKDFRL